MSERLRTPGALRQTGAAIIMCLSSLVLGMAASWTSNVIVNLQQKDNDLNITPITDEEKSWLTSVTPLGLLTTMLVAPKVCEVLGRQRMAIAGALIFIITWLLKFFAMSFYTILAAQILQGVANGFASLVIPIYLTEATSSAIRGRLVSLFILSVKGGFLLGFILVSLLPYKITTGCILVIPVIQFGGLFLLPETPIYLFRHNRITAAEKSLMWLRGDDRVAVNAELLELKKLHQNILQAKTSLNIMDLFVDPVNRKGFLISLMMFVVNEMSGMSVMLLYIVTILHEAKIVMSPDVASITYGVSLFAGCWVSTLTVDHFGRRPLLLGSLFIMAIAHCMISLFFTMQNLNFEMTGYDWVIISAVNLYGFSFCIGVGPLTTVVANEVINPEFASICNSAQLMITGVTAFALSKTFPMLVSIVGYQNYFFIFAATCIIGFFMVLYIVPETNGKSIKSIREELQAQNSSMENTITA